MGAGLLQSDLGSSAPCTHFLAAACHPPGDCARHFCTNWRKQHSQVTLEPRHSQEGPPGRTESQRCVAPAAPAPFLGTVPAARTWLCAWGREGRPVGSDSVFLLLSDVDVRPGPCRGRRRHYIRHLPVCPRVNLRSFAHRSHPGAGGPDACPGGSSGDGFTGDLCPGPDHVGRAVGRHCGDICGP